MKPNFKNYPTERFYEHFKRLIDRREVTPEDMVATLFDEPRYQKNPSNFLTGLKRGDSSITVEHILRARDMYNLSPASLFEKEEMVSTANDESGGTDIESLQPAEHFGATLKGLLKRHKVRIDPFCKNVLRTTRQNLYAMLRGEQRIPLSLAVTVCEDLGESLDVFRSRPLPLGHLQTEVELLKLRLSECQRHLADTQAQLAKKEKAGTPLPATKKKKKTP